MKLTLFTISEGAYNKGGSLTIVNTFDNVSVSSFPAKVPIAFAIKLSTTPEDGGDRKITIVIRHIEKERELSRIESNLKVPNTNGNFVFAANINGFAFPEAGSYSFSLLFDDTYVTDLKISVNRNE